MQLLHQLPLITDPGSVDRKQEVVQQHILNDDASYTQGQRSALLCHHNVLQRVLGFNIKLQDLVRPGLGQNWSGSVQDLVCVTLFLQFM